jgi:hypothetical protein
MLLQVLKRLALGQVVRKLFEITEPELFILPINIPKTFHAAKIAPRPEPGQAIVSDNNGAKTQSQGREIAVEQQRNEDAKAGNQGNKPETLTRQVNLYLRVLASLLFN